MKLAEIGEVLAATFLVETEFDNSQICYVYDADLVRDVPSIEFLDLDGVLLLTSLIGPQLTTVISLTSIKAIVFVRG